MSTIFPIAYGLADLLADLEDHNRIKYRKRGGFPGITYELLNAMVEEAADAFELDSAGLDQLDVDGDNPEMTVREAFLAEYELVSKGKSLRTREEWGTATMSVKEYQRDVPYGIPPVGETVTVIGHRSLFMEEAYGIVAYDSLGSIIGWYASGGVDW